ncbi:hypothetical protein EPZ47_19375 [Pseudomonas viciae]|uniref:Uncharacterized protein n=1 Tax=Pseudomonas viciae TaxID=2505979 RepID=A0A4P7PKC9_9PSED|nr:hypothetical protein EPZ47_19375 [Pseudomonas viciae]
MAFSLDLRPANGCPLFSPLLAARYFPSRAEAGDNVRGALDTIGENAGHIKQGLARLRAQGLI